MWVDFILASCEIAYTNHMWVEERIHIFREKIVMLDRDVATTLGISTRALNQVVKRNKKRFPSDFIFRLTKEESTFFNAFYKYQIDTYKNVRKKTLKRLPLVFTEEGILMAACILNSSLAVDIHREFVRKYSKKYDLIKYYYEIFF
jgi:hypothetical protein